MNRSEDLFPTHLESPVTVQSLSCQLFLSLVFLFTEFRIVIHHIKGQIQMFVKIIPEQDN